MHAVQFTNLLIVVAIGLFAPLTLGFFPRLRLPALCRVEGAASAPA
jgi:hypothetical protein